MNRSKLDDALREQITLDTLGALEAQERRDLESVLATLDPVEQSAALAERRALEAIGAELALSVQPVRPPDAVRQRVLEAVRIAPADTDDAYAVEPASAATAPDPADLSTATAPTQPGFLFVRENDGEWEPIGVGIERKILVAEAGRGSRSFLVRMQPGAHIRRHAHPHDEHCMLLAGDLLIDGRRLSPGDYHRAAAGSVHEGLTSPTGCTLLIVEAVA